MSSTRDPLKGHSGARGFSRAGAQSLDKRRECRSWLPLTWIVEEETRERRTPVFQNAHQCPTCEMRRDAVLVRKRQAHTIDRRTDRELHVIDDQRSVHGDSE